jgi:hypothetical protein
MNVNRIGDDYVIRLNQKEAEDIYQFVGLKIAMGNIGGGDPMELVALLLAKEVERTKDKSKKPK